MLQFMLSVWAHLPIPRLVLAIAIAIAIPTYQLCMLIARRRNSNPLILPNDGEAWQGTGRKESVAIGVLCAPRGDS